MSRTFFYFLILSFSGFVLGDQIEIIDILDTDVFCWDIEYRSIMKANITAQNYWLYVQIHKCFIWEPSYKPDDEYLLLRNGNQDNKRCGDVKIFINVKELKDMLFESDSVILELKTSSRWTYTCRVCFTRVPKPTTPLLLRTTEIPPTEKPGVSGHSTLLISGGNTTTTEKPGVSKYSTTSISGENITSTEKTGVSKYSTILISGKNYTNREILVMKIKENLVQMAKNYTETEGFCLENGTTIQTSDVKINMIEQCPKEWPNSEDCVRIGYALPIKINESCSLWKGYQLTGKHLDIMWSRMAREYLDGELKVYKKPDVDSAITWWIVGIVLTFLVLVGATIAMNFAWKRRNNMEGSRCG